MAACPLPSLNRLEHTRTDRLKQVIIIPEITRARLMLAFGVGLLCLLVSARLHPILAEAPGTATVSIIPADGKARGLQVRAQTVDALIMQDAEGVWADTRLWVQLYNPGKQPIVVPIALPGPQPGATELPVGLEVTLDNKPLELQPILAKTDGATIGQTATITVPLRGSVALRAHYRQALPEKDDLVTFAYPLTATLRWSGTPESLRVTVRFDPPVTPEQMLSHAPAAKRYDRDGITWHLENTRAEQSVAAAFMTPTWWAEFLAARNAAAAPGAGPTEHLALSRHYRRLGGLAPPPFDPGSNYAERYYPAEVAALQAGIAAADGATAPAELAAAHIRLAELYWMRAEHPAAGQSDAYRQMTASELEAAAALDNTNTELRAAAADLYDRLAQDAQARGDAVTAGQHQTRATALAAQSVTASEQALARAVLLVRATQAVDAGAVSQARRLTVEAVGPQSVTLPAAPPPRATQAILDVMTSPTQRTFTLRLAGGDDAAALLARAAEALAVEPAARAVAAGELLTVTLAYTDAERLAAPQARLAAALPPAPELALLAAGLAPRSLAWEARPEWIKLTERYVEQIDLAPARQAWEAQASRLAAAAQTEGTPDAQSNDARLPRLQQAFWTADAEAWRSLADASRARYRVELGDGTIRQWEVGPGDARVLEASVSHTRLDHLAAIGAAAAILVLCLAAAIWRLL